MRLSFLFLHLYTYSTKCAITYLACRRGFDPEVRRKTDGVVAATCGLFAAISEALLPTPAKFHYSFNLRDVSKVFQVLYYVQ